MELNIIGLDGFETIAIDDRTIIVRPILISIKDKTPPKDEIFLGLTSSGLKMFEWSESIVDGVSKVFFRFNCSCSCCTGNCTDKFEFWMKLPKCDDLNQQKLIGMK